MNPTTQELGWNRHALLRTSHDGRGSQTNPHPPTIFKIDLTKLNSLKASEAALNQRTKEPKNQKTNEPILLRSLKLI